MLVGTRAYAEPAVIGDVDDPGCPAADERACLFWKNDFVADQWEQRRSPRYGEHSVLLTWDVPAANPSQLHQAQSFQEILEGQVFAKRYQVYLVIERGHRAPLVEHIDRVVSTPDVAIRPRRSGAHRSGDQHSARRKQIEDRGQCFALIGQEEWKCRLGPDEVRDISNTVRTRRGWSPRQGHVALHNLRPRPVIEARVLRKVRLHDPQFDVVNKR